MPSDDSNNKVLGIKIDVDTYQGMKNGVPRLLDILGTYDIKGTFFLSIGPDASGRAILQLIKNPLFLKKMVRTNAVGLYGLRTVLYGTLLPSPMSTSPCACILPSNSPPSLTEPRETISPLTCVSSPIIEFIPT